MLHVDEIIKVDVVTNLWTDALLHLAAIAISVGTLVWTMIDRLKDRARIRIETSIVHVVGDPSSPGPLVAVDCTNVGHSGSTILKSICFQDRRRGGKLWVLEESGGMGLTGPNRLSPMPLELEPGRDAFLRTSPERLAAACIEHGIRPDHLQVVVSTAHGEFRRAPSRAVTSAIRHAVKPGAPRRRKAGDPTAAN